MRIVHLSDLHLHASQADSDNCNAFVLAHDIISRFSRADDQTIVVATGDLTDDGTEPQRANALEWLLQLKGFFRVFSCPGNHDYAWQGNVFDPSAAEPFRKLIGASQFPTVWHNGEVTLIGLDSADPEDWEWFAEGVIGGRQLSELSSLLDIAAEHNRLPILYLHHHPFCRDLGMPLVDSEELMRVLTEKRPGPQPVLLFGHRHISELWIERKGLAQIAASGKVTEADANGVLRYRVLTIQERRVVDTRVQEIAAA